ncbi:hypothetical protein [Zooshikella ganghwensis]|uniref:hypothetical protein n=1 Tax=Zooshikella ganghwensis TaxID=202772 RepID=UPI000401D385|nr:hypothetical protein [Zooshikella ganghwensis]
MVNVRFLILVFALSGNYVFAEEENNCLDFAEGGVIFHACYDYKNGLLVYTFNKPHHGTHVNANFPYHEVLIDNEQLLDPSMSDTTKIYKAHFRINTNGQHVDQLVADFCTWDPAYARHKNWQADKCSGWMVIGGMPYREPIFYYP